MKKFLYRVNEGDCVCGLAKRFNQSVFDLISDNNLTAEVCAGDILVVNSCQQGLYEVTPGDSISSIAKKVGVTTEKLSLDNGATPYVFYGITLKI